MQKNIKNVILGMLLTVFLGGKTSALDTVQIGQQNLKLLYSLYTATESDIYQKTWDKSKTLRENQQKLLDDFKQYCVFMIDPSCQDAVNSALEQIVSSAVGCMLLRTLIAKYGYEAADLQKIAILSAPTGRYSVFNVPECSFLNPIILLDEESIRNECQLMLVEPVLGATNDAKTLEYHFTEKMVSLDVALFHEMLHWLHYVRDRNSLLKKRDDISPKNRFVNITLEFMNSFTTKIDGKIVYKNKPDEEVFPQQIAESCFRLIFGNDEEYLTLYGFLDDDKFDPLNEAAYLRATGRLFIRGGGRGKKDFEDLALSFEDIQVSFRRDSALLRYYLAPEFNPVISFFGVGNFETSDRNKENSVAYCPFSTSAEGN
jgi:hypothetical protein